MTEHQWQSCSDPSKMLTFLQGKVSARKLRLFACACCRQVWNPFADPASVHSVWVAEQFADGLATEADRAKAEAVALQAAQESGSSGFFYLVASARAAAHACAADPNVAAQGAADNAARAACDAPLAPDILGRRQWKADYQRQRQDQALVLRDLLGNPFRPVWVEPSWLCWQEGLVPKLAAVIYQERRFRDLPLLADALEEAGCANREMLQHGRQPGAVHARGCWLVDLVLGRP